MNQPDLKSRIVLCLQLIDRLTGSDMGAESKAISEELTATLNKLKVDISTIQGTLTLLHQKNTLLEKRLNSDKWVPQKKRYKLIEKQAGKFVYSIQSEESGTEDPHHYVCPTCYQNQTKSILQRVDAKNMDEVYKCLCCHNIFEFPYELDLSSLDRCGYL